MNKEQYQAQLQALKREQQILEQKFILLDEQYLEANAEHRVEDKVIIIDSRGKETVAFVRERDVDNLCNKAEIKYKFYKAKKDGTPSKNHVFAYFGDKVVPFSKNEES